MKKVVILILISGFILCFPFKTKAKEVTSEGIAIEVQIEDKNVADGSIISLSDGKYRLSTMSYDNTVFGIVTNNPAVVFKDQIGTAKKPVVTFGKALVRVSTVNGNIKTGDLITTSTIPGVGQKATENGYVIGIAQEDYEGNNPKQTGSIYIVLHLNFGMLSTSVRENLISSLQQGARSPLSSPLNALRYLVAGFIVILSFAAGFWFFGRISSRGIEAMGRNPLARRFILLSVIFNVVITVTTMFLGVALAYLILVI